MNQKICIAVLFVAFCLCLTNAVPTYGGLSLGLGQQYPRSYGFGINPYAGSYGGIGSTDPVYSNGFGSEYGSRYGSYGSYSSPYGSYNHGYGYGGGIGSGSGYNGGYGGYGGLGGAGGGFQY